MWHAKEKRRILLFELGKELGKRQGQLQKQSVFVAQIRLVDLLDSWATSATRRCAAAWHASLRHTTSTTCSLVDLHHDRIHDTLQFFLLCLELVFLCKLVLVKPVKRVLNGLLNLLLIVTLKLVLKFFLGESVTHCEAVVFQAILCFNFGLVLLVLCAILLCLLHHPVDFGL